MNVEEERKELLVENGKLNTMLREKMKAVMDLER